jgi:DNA helicase TIP49 (TBP-interacting protein)
LGISDDGTAIEVSHGMVGQEIAREAAYVAV